MKPICLTIAGSDSGGGAGIQADIKSFEANGVFAASAITAVTAQNTVGINASFDLPLHIIDAQIEAICSDLDVAAVKTGMLSSTEIIGVVAAAIRRHRLHPVVVDPVMISKSGFSLLAEDSIGALISDLLPLAHVVTPNAYEAERLSGIPVEGLEAAREAARRIHKMGPENVLVKGGHIVGGDEAVDVLFDGTGFELFSEQRIQSRNTHGIGCSFAAAIAANLAKGRSLVDAVAVAKRYVTEALRCGLDIGSGPGTPDRFFFIDGSATD